MMRAIAVAMVISGCGAEARKMDAPKGGVVKEEGPPRGEAKRAEPTVPGLRLPGDVVPRGYELELQLDADKDAFAGKVAIDVQVERPTEHLWLNAEELEIQSARWIAAGKSVELPAAEPRDGYVGFPLPAGTAPGAYRIEIGFTGSAAARQMQGLFRQQDGGKWYLYSQFESISARHAFPCFDEPGFKVPWTVTLIVPPGQKGYGNAPVAKQMQLGDGRTRIELAPTPAIPSYLVAVAVGPFEEVDAGTVGRAKVPARIIVPAGRTGEAKAAAINMPRIIAALEDYFDMPLPFAKLDSIAVPDFFGAMENPGLITYASNILLARPERDNERFRELQISIAAHELAHQWFGDYVTLAWWDDIWLNESFATWMAEKIAHQLLPRWDRDARSTEAANTAMRADARVAAQPLHRPITNTKQIEGTFDAIAYDKGGAILTMFEGWIGEDHFRDGVRQYMKAHARGSATSADFLAALEAASTADVGTAFRAYLEQPGVPVVHAELTCAKGAAPTVHLHQDRLVAFGETAPDMTWPIRACVRFGAAPDARTCTTFATKDADVALTAKTCPAWITANAGAAGYYRVDYTADLRARLSKHLRKVPAIERMAFAADLTALVDAGRTGASDALALVTPLLATHDDHDLSSAVGLVAATEDLVDDATHPAWRRWVIARLGKAARATPLQPPPDELPAEHEARVQLLHLVGIAARDAKLAARARKLVDPWLAGKGDAPRDAEIVLWLAARTDDAKLFDAILAKAKAIDDRQLRSALLGALGYFSDPKLIDRAQQIVVTGEFDIFEGGQILRAQMTTPDGGRAVGVFVRAHWDQVLKALPGIAQPYLVLMQGRVCDAAARAEVEAFVRPRIGQVSNGEHALGDTLQNIDTCIARRKALSGDLAAIVKAGTSRPGRAASSR